MFNDELFNISERFIKSTNLEDIEKRNREMEKAVLEIIKKHSNYINSDGISRIEIMSHKDEDYHYNNDYKVLSSIILLGKQKYFEEEYSLYFVSDDYVEAYSDSYSVITFVWNSIEYNMKNKPKVKKNRI